MYNGGRSVRAYRPSHCAAHSDMDEFDQEIEDARRANVLRYAARVSAGLAIFSNSAGSEPNDDMGTLAV